MVLEKFFETYTAQVTSAWLYILILTILMFCLMVYLGGQGLTRRYRSIPGAFFSRGLMAVSLAGILALTLCGREWGSRMGSSFQFLPFWSYWRAFTQGDEGLIHNASEPDRPERSVRVRAPTICNS